MAALYILNLASTGINFRILISTPTAMLAFLPDSDMCSVKDCLRFTTADYEKETKGNLEIAYFSIPSPTPWFKF